MSDPRRLLDEGSDLEIAVLDSARDDAAPKHLHKRIHAALGLGGAIVGAGIGAGTATTAAAATTTATAAKGAGLLASVGVAKWVGIAMIGTVAAAGAVGATAYVEHRSAAEARATATSSQTSIADPTPAPNGTTTATPSATATATSTATSTSTPGGPTATTVTASVPPAHDPSPTLLSELAPLDAARSALESGDTVLALAQLDRHDRDFPRGQLAPEALALRVDTYAQRHDDTKVAELADAFLARYPRHPEARRIEAVAASARHNP